MEVLNLRKTVKIAVSLPEDLLEEAERERKAIGESRSAFVQKAIRMVLEHKDREKALNRYIEGYRLVPESAEEIEAARRTAEIVFAEEPFDSSQDGTW